MALRIEIRIGALLMSFLEVCPAQTFSYDVRHEHWRKGGEGVLRIDGDSISFVETGKAKEHSRTWKYADIQQLSVEPSEIRILTYEDQRWQLGRDREYTFDRLPAQAAKELYPFLRSKLDRRFVAEVADSEIQPLWQMDVKLQQKWGGSQGRLLVGADRIVFETEKPGESRSWRYKDIDNISSSSPLDLTIMSAEHSGWSHAGTREFRFQLKQELAETRYDDLWRRVNSSHGLEILGKAKGESQ